MYKTGFEEIHFRSIITDTKDLMSYIDLYLTEEWCFSQKIYNDMVFKYGFPFEKCWYIFKIIAEIFPLNLRNLSEDFRR